MKKVLSLALSLFLILVSAISVFAADRSDVSLGVYQGENSESVFVSVSISEGGKPVMIQFCVAYDSEKLECVSVSTGDAFSGTSAPLINETAGKIYFIWDSLTPLSGGGTMLSIEFVQIQNSDAEVWIDTTESFVVANSKFETVGSASGSVVIKGSEEEQKPESSNSSSASSSTSSETTSSESTSSEAPSSKPGSSESTSSGNKLESGSNNGITIDKNEVSVGTKEEVELEIIEGEKENVIWYSSNEDVVKVEDGKIVPVSPGTAVITVQEEEGENEATCVVTVTEDDVASKETEDEKSEGSEIETIVVTGNKKEENKIPVWAVAIIAVVLAAIVFLTVKIILKAKK